MVICVVFLQHALLQKEKSSLNDIDNLPVEAFYCTALKLNEIKDGNINSILQLKEAAEKLGFVLGEYDAMDGFIYVTLELKEE